MSVSTRREEEKLRRRTSILQAAKELFYEKGYQNTTVDEIAERAEHGKGTIYLYFSGKDELYVSTIEEGYQELEEKLLAAIKRKRGVEQKIRAIYNAFVDHCLDNKEYFRITQYFLTEYAHENISAELKDRIYDLSFNLLGISSDMVQEGINSGIFRKELNPMSMSLIGWRLATGLLDVALVGGMGDRAVAGQDLFEDAITLLINGAKIVK